MISKGLAWFQKLKIGWSEWGMILLFILPPAGIAVLLLSGWLHLYRIVKRRKPFELKIETFFFLSLFLASVLASIQFHKWTYFASPALILGYFGFYLYTKQHGSLSSFRHWIWITIGGGLYVAVLGFIQMTTHTAYSTGGVFSFLTGTRLFGYDQPDRLFGSAYNPNFASFLLLYALALLLVVLLHQMHGTGRRVHVLLITCIFIVSAAIIETGSRTGFACMAMLLLLFFFRFRWKIGVFLIIVFAVCSQELIQWLPRTTYLGESMDTRKIIWETSVRIWEKYPYFGVTMQGFQDMYQNFTGEYIAHPHNIFLAFFVIYGTLGGMAFLLLLAVLLYQLTALLVSCHTHKEFFEMFLFLFPVTLLTGLFDYPMFSPQTALLAVGLLGQWGYYLRTCSFALDSKKIGALRLLRKKNS